MDLALGKMRIVARIKWKTLRIFRRWIIIFKKIFTSQN